MIIDQADQPCARKGCSCEVPAGQTYCGPHCANAGADSVAESNPAYCACGHESCSENVEAVQGS